MKYVVLGASEFAACCTRALIECGAAISGIISLPADQLPNNSMGLGGLAQKWAIPYAEYADLNTPEGLACLSSFSPDIVLSTWPKILRPPVLAIPRICAIGTHPTDLPFNRGRHPLHWLLAMGIPVTKLSFFRMDAGIDTGNLMCQVPFELGTSIADAVEAMNQAAAEGTRMLYIRLAEDPYWSGIQQNHDMANYWRKRTPHDITLDPRMSASMVLRTVQSFTLPYPCANLIFGRHIVKIRAASIVNTGLTHDELQRLEPGKIMGVEHCKLRIKVDDAIVELHCVEPLPVSLQKAAYVHPPSRYLTEWPPEIRERLA